MSNYIVLEKSLIRKAGMDAAALFGVLTGERKEEEFFCSVEEVEKELGLSVHKQRKALKALEELGFVEVQYKGIPPRRCIKVKEGEIGY